MNVLPESYKTGAVSEKYPEGRWLIHHDYKYYANNTGLSTQTEKYSPDLVCNFDKPGKYSIYFDDELVKEVYAHRLPVANFTMKINDTNVSYTSNSYDLDSDNDIGYGKGITSEKWEYKLADANTWTEGKITTIDKTKVYVVKLTVTDEQGASSYSTQYIGRGNPVALFDYENQVLSKYKKLFVTNTSYDPQGYDITAWEWILKKNGNKIATYTEQTPSVVDFNTDSFGLGDYSYTLTVTNSQGTKSEAFTKSFTVVDDTTVPEIMVNPTNCEWKKSQDVAITVTDDDSGLKNWKYLVNNAQATPSATDAGWSEYTTESEKTITIDGNGIKYLHIEAEDNAGNIGKGRIIGPYRIDNTAPNIAISGDLTTITTDSIDLKAIVTDTLSGVKNITINGQDYENESIFEITRNGTYTIIATDNVGNVSSQDIVVTNKYVKCTAGLDHPDYSSTYDECPICKLLKSIKVEDTTFTYDGEEHNITYQNPDNSEINIYYNGEKEIPSKAGTYNYEMKVVYDGKEYRTPFVGEMTILKKDITISEIKALDKKYDRNSAVFIKDGKLNGVVDKDYVTFILPLLGTAQSSKIGTWPVTISTILLAGTDKDNYNLIQPKAEDVTVNILDPNAPALYLETAVESINNKTYESLTEQNVRIEDKDIVKILIKVKNKGVGAGYAKNVKIELPEVVKLIKGDELNKKYGWKTEKDNAISTDLYKFENGEENELPGVQLLDSEEKLKENEKQIKSTEEDTNYLTLEANVKITNLPKEYIDIPIKINVTQTNINNDIVEDTLKCGSSTLNLRSNYSDVAIKQYISSINNEDTKQKVTTKDEILSVEQRDIITYTIRVYNQGETNSFASKITYYADKGLEFISTNEINAKYKWKMVDKNGKETNNVSDAYKFESNYLENIALDSFDGKELKYKDIQISFKVKDGIGKKDLILENKAEITETKDIRGNEVYNICDDKIDSSKIKVKYFDLSLKQVSSKYKIYEDGKLISENTSNTNTLIKLELNRRKINNLKVKIYLTYVITNEGEIAGNVKEITEYIPKGFELLEAENNGWKNKSGNIATTEQLENVLIKPGESRTVQIVLTWKNTDKIFDNFKNIMEISKDKNPSETKDIDSTPNNKKGNEDDIAIQNILITISTGIAKATLQISIIMLIICYISLVIYCFLIIFKK